MRKTNPQTMADLYQRNPWRQYICSVDLGGGFTQDDCSATKADSVVLLTHPANHTAPLRDKQEV